MVPLPLAIPHSVDVWPRAARVVLDEARLRQPARVAVPDLSTVRVIVMSMTQACLLKAALSRLIAGPFIAPRITTLDAWLATAPDDGAHTEAAAPGDGARLLSLYAGLRQHGWLRRLFAARRNADLMPLAHSLLDLFDRLTASLLPDACGDSGATVDDNNDNDNDVRAALDTLSSLVREGLSEEAYLVWSLWKSQLGPDDPVVRRYARLMQLCARETAPLIWIGGTAPDAMQAAFLARHAKQAPVRIVLPAWDPTSVPALLAAAWPDMLEDTPREATLDMDIDAQAPVPDALPGEVAFIPAASLEDEAVQAARTVLEWLDAGRSRIAVVVCDRQAGRRLQALLRRAALEIADETPRTLSSTAAAGALSALLELIASRGASLALLRFLKSPFVLPGLDDKSMRVARIESALRRHHVTGGWQALSHVLGEDIEASEESAGMLAPIAALEGAFRGRKTAFAWLDTTWQALRGFGMPAALASDPAGRQLLALLDSLAPDIAADTARLSFAEWQAFLHLLCETPLTTPARTGDDAPVVMLELAGARLRAFDAILVLGADAERLPAPSEASGYFPAAVRRDLGLGTRQAELRTQLRDLAALFAPGRSVVFSWQAMRDGEANLPSPWLSRLSRVLEQRGLPPIPSRRQPLPRRAIMPRPVGMPAPAAPDLLPAILDARGFRSLMACPYQFFAGAMLALEAQGELKDTPGKRDYSQWLHRILDDYHAAVRDGDVPPAERLSLLREMSRRVFEEAIRRSSLAMAYYARWQKAMPAYLDWANEREAQGWTFLTGAQTRERRLAWEDGDVLLRGRVDRIDVDAHGNRVLLDYQARKLSRLREEAAEAGTAQADAVSFLGLLADAPVNAGHLVALEPAEDKTGMIDFMDLAARGQALEARLARRLEAIAHGAPMPATGAESDCRLCAMRGLCRKGGWW